MLTPSQPTLRSASYRGKSGSSMDAVNSWDIQQREPIRATHWSRLSQATRS